MTTNGEVQGTVIEVLVRPGNAMAQLAADVLVALGPIIVADGRERITFKLGGDSSAAEAEHVALSLVSNRPVLSGTQEMLSRILSRILHDSFGRTVVPLWPSESHQPGATPRS